MDQTYYAITTTTTQQQQPQGSQFQQLTQTAIPHYASPVNQGSQFQQLTQTTQQFQQPQQQQGSFMSYQGSFIQGVAPQYYTAYQQAAAPPSQPPPPPYSTLQPTQQVLNTTPQSILAYGTQPQGIQVTSSQFYGASQVGQPVKFRSEIVYSDQNPYLSQSQHPSRISQQQQQQPPRDPYEDYKSTSIKIVFN